MDYDIRSILNHWTDRSVTQSRSLPDYGSEGAAFSGRLQWTTADSITGSALVVNGFAVRTTRRLPAEGETISLERVTEAPAPELPYLVAIHGEGKERLRQYTGIRPLETVIEKLSGTSFTGYIELSDRVFSGDYYAVFYGGKPNFVGIIDSERQPLRGNDSKRRMLDEVGIYSVNTVVPDPIDLSSLPTERSEPGIRTESSAERASDSSGNTRVFASKSNGETTPSGTTNIFGSSAESAEHGNDTEVFQPNCGTTDETSEPETGAGQHQTGEWYCYQCGEGVPANARFCSYCGAKLRLSD